MFNAEQSYKEWKERELHYTPAEWMQILGEQQGRDARDAFWEVFRREHVKLKRDCEYFK